MHVKLWSGQRRRLFSGRGKLCHLWLHVKTTWTDWVISDASVAHTSPKLPTATWKESALRCITWLSTTSTRSMRSIGSCWPRPRSIPRLSDPRPLVVRSLATLSRWWCPPPAFRAWTIARTLRQSCCDTRARTSSRSTLPTSTNWYVHAQHYACAYSLPIPAIMFLLLSTGAAVQVELPWWPQIWELPPQGLLPPQAIPCKPSRPIPLTTRSNGSFPVCRRCLGCPTMRAASCKGLFLFRCSSASTVSLVLLLSVLLPLWIASSSSFALPSLILTATLVLAGEWLFSPHTVTYAF